MERIATGISGLDEMIEGGLKKNSITLVSGGCGAGKSIFCMNYIYAGAMAGENGLYVTFEETAHELKDNMSSFGWDLDGLEQEGKIKIVRIPREDILRIVKDEYSEIKDYLDEVKAKRVVIDSISGIEQGIANEVERRDAVLKLCEWLKEHECTTLITSEAEQEPLAYSRHETVEFLVDGVIILYNIRHGNKRLKALEVLKMRGTKHTLGLFPIRISKGIEVFQNAEIF